MWEALERNTTYQEMNDSVFAELEAIAGIDVMAAAAAIEEDLDEGE